MKNRRDYDNRYLCLAGTGAIDEPPANRHGWINRAAALYRWAVRGDCGATVARDMARIAFTIASGRSAYVAFDTNTRAIAGLNQADIDLEAITIGDWT